MTNVTNFFKDRATVLKEGALNGVSVIAAVALASGINALVQ
ncbi:hypothetical protein [Yunchengibacter salinarum]